MQSQQPFNNLFTGFADEERDLTVDDEAFLSGTDPLPQPTDPEPSPAVGAAAMPVRIEPADEPNEVISELAELRLRFEAAQSDILAEIKHLRSENQRLSDENQRWKTLIKEYKQILSGE